MIFRIHAATKWHRAQTGQPLISAGFIPPPAVCPRRIWAKTVSSRLPLQRVETQIAGLVSGKFSKRFHAAYLSNSCSSSRRSRLPRIWAHTVMVSPKTLVNSISSRVS